MLSPNHCECRRDIVLGVMVADCAVALRFSNVAGKQEGRCWWGTHACRWSVVSSAPTQLGQIIARKNWRPRVNKPASGQVDIENGRRRKRVVHVDDQELAMVELRTTILAKTCPQWIRGKVGQTVIRKSPEQPGISADVLVPTHDEFVCVTTRG